MKTNNEINNKTIANPMSLLGCNTISINFCIVIVPFVTVSNNSEIITRKLFK